MGKRFLSSSYKQELYHKITSYSQKNLKVDESIREFDNSKRGLGWTKTKELTIVRFIKRLSPSIANKVELRLYLSLMIFAT